MDTTKPWLQLLEAHIIDDALRAQAYEKACAQERQMLKTAIAYHALQGPCPSAESCFREHKNKGFWQRRHSAPAPLLFILCGEEYCSPARLIAAAMPALLAGVTETIFLQVGRPHPTLLATLELLGIEEAYALPSAHEALQLLRCLDTSPLRAHNQRLILLHQQQSLAALRPMIEDLHIPYFEEASPPHIFMPPTISEVMKKNVLFAQPDAMVVSSPFDFAHAYYGMEKPSLNLLSQAITQGTTLYNQHFSQGLEACWHMANLNADFFLNHYTLAGTTFDTEL